MVSQERIVEVCHDVEFGVGKVKRMHICRGFVRLVSEGSVTVVYSEELQGPEAWETYVS